jgi:hypothetical protein
MAPRRREPPSADTLDRRQPQELAASAEPLALGTPDTSGPPVRPKRTRRSSMFTSTPETPPPVLFCPGCDRPLVYRQTVVSGVQPIERWDYFQCHTCGPFVYRDRTRKLRPIA